ncbi:MAG TPA: PAS domain S-box protein [Ferruginibacter sp.]|jgi:PAS domain S-box-containing protein|nr:PAS domain S-box protein [Ferruginibacter sp.]
MSFVKKIASSGTFHANNPTAKRNILIVNYFSIIFFLGNVTLIIVRTILYFCLANKRIIIGTNGIMVITSLLFLFPLVLNRLGYLRLARLYLCWLPSILIMSVYVMDALQRTIVLTSEYDSLYFFLLGASAVPYLLLSLSNKKELVAGLSVPVFFIFFSDRIMNLFAVGHHYKGIADDGFEINRMRALVAYFVLSGCCFVLKILVEHEVNKNALLITELEEKNKLIDKQAEKEILESENKYRLLFEQAADAIIVSRGDNSIESVNPSARQMFGYSDEEFLSIQLDDMVEEEDLAKSPIDLERYRSQKALYRERILIKKDGTVFPVEINAKMLPDGSLQSFIRDITDRKKAEAEIQKSESRYRLLYEQAADAITIVNKHRRFEQVNSSACEIFGYTRDEFLLLSLEDILDKEALKTNPLNFNLLIGDKIVRNERILRRKDGSTFPAEINVKRLPEEGFQSFIRDITDRKKAEEEIIEAEAKFRDLVEKSSVGVYIIQGGKYRYVNPKFAIIFGYEQEEITDSIPVESLAHPDYMELIRDNMRKRIDGTKETVPYEIDGVKKDGDIIRLEIFGTRTQYKGEPAIIGTLSDITENKILQKQVLDQKVQEQKRITRAVLKAEEKERNRIGQELHDNVNQILAGTKLYLGLASKDEFAGRGLIKSSLELVDNAIEEMRSLSKEQVTPIKGIDLKDLVYSLIDRLNAGSAIKTTVIYDLKNQVIEDDIKLNIYRIIQEQMNNILKHSNASQTNIALIDDDQNLYLTVEDNGDGFDPEQTRKGIGLSNMKNRIESFNGEFEIYSSLGNGCEMKITIPYSTNNG